jgi:hypothetical protein
LISAVANIQENQALSCFFDFDTIVWLKQNPRNKKWTQEKS